MVINEVSVSRKHCRLEVERGRQEVRLVDNGAKFGTSLEITKTEIYHSQEFQRGRTKLKFTKKHKASLLERLGLCSPGPEQLQQEFRQ